MTATKAPTRRVAPLCAGVAGSTVLHATLFAIAAAIPAGLFVASRGPDELGRPLAVTVVIASDDAPLVIVSASTIDTARIPPPPPETIDFPDWTVAEAPHVVDAMRDSPATPWHVADGGPNWSRQKELASLHPGHGAAGSSAIGSPGRGTIGVGGARGSGGSGDGAGGAAVGSLAGLGTGDGGDGTGTGWAARGGETRGPAIVGSLSSPPYPPKARAHGWEGRVVLVLTIDEHGRVTAVDVAESSGRAALDDAAREAASEWTLAPALRDGEPVAGTLRVPVRFELTD